MAQKSFIYFLILLRRLGNRFLDPVFGRSHIVHGTKAILLICAVALIMVMVIFPLLDRKKDDYIPAITDNKTRRVSTPTMMNPNFQGTDKHNRPYHISADTAIKTEDNKIALTNVTADIQLSETQFMKSHSTHAIYAIDRNILDLYGDIQIITDNNYQLETTAIHMDLNQSKTIGKNKVKLTGSPGILFADQFILEGEDHLIFNDHVKMILYPRDN